MLLLTTGLDRVDRRMLECSVAGAPFAEALTAALRRDASVRHHVAGSALSSEIEAAASSGILVADADVWFPAAAAARILGLVRHAARPFRIVAGGDVLAIYLPPPHAVDCLRKGDLPACATAVALQGAGDVAARATDEVRGAMRLRDWVDVACCESAILRARAEALARSGVRIRDLDRVWIRGELRCGAGVEIDTGVIVEGTVELGDDVKVGAHCILAASTIGAGCDIRPYTIVENATVGAGTFVGPYGRLRPGAVIGERSQIGNFVEIKNSDVGPGSRINHMAFVGDATLGARATLGAGTVTCNHTGTGVARTEIGEGAYVGSGTMLVAPVTIGANAMVGAGSTVTKDAPAGRLTLARARQVVVPGWRPASAASNSSVSTSEPTSGDDTASIDDAAAVDGTTSTDNVVSSNESAVDGEAQ